MNHRSLCGLGSSCNQECVSCSQDDHLINSPQSRGSPVIGSRKSWSWNRLGLVLSPHQILQLAELIPEVGVGGGDGLRDGGVEVDDPRLGGGTQVSIACVVLLAIIQI